MENISRSSKIIKGTHRDGALGWGSGKLQRIDLTQATMNIKFHLHALNMIPAN